MSSYLVEFILVLVAVIVVLISPQTIPWFFGMVLGLARRLVDVGGRQLASLRDQGTQRAALKRPPASRRREATLPVPHLPKGLDKVGLTSGLGLRALGYKVCLGDTLKVVAHEVLGDSDMWFELWQLNRARIPNPGLLVPGTILTLPRGYAPPER